MNKSTYTTLFTIVSTIVNIIMTLAIIFLLIVLSTLILTRMFHVENGSVIVVFWMICFIGGMILGMVLFAKLSNFVIEHFGLSSKLDSRLLGRYLPGGKKMPVTPEEERPKTNMPQASIPVEDED